MAYATFRPHPALEKVIDYYWFMKVELQDSLLQDVATPMLQGMTFNLGSYQEQMNFSSQQRRQLMKEPVHIFGQPLSHRVSISSQEGIHILGVKFRELGFHLLSGINMRHLADQIHEGRSLLGRRIHYLAEQLCETPALGQQIALLNRYFFDQLQLRKKKYTDPSVAEALSVINHSNGCLRVGQLNKAIAASPRTLERRFVSQLGITPKQYHRIVRYNRVKSCIDRGCSDWQDISYRFGYTDQSHFIKEFKRYAGRTPTAYCRAVQPVENIF